MRDFSKLSESAHTILMVLTVIIANIAKYEHIIFLYFLESQVGKHVSSIYDTDPITGSFQGSVVSACSLAGGVCCVCLGGCLSISCQAALLSVRVPGPHVPTLGWGSRMNSLHALLWLPPT